MLHVPDFLVDQQSDFFQSKEDLKKYFLWLAKESGYYRKIENTSSHPFGEESPSPNLFLQPNIYNPGFDD